MGEYDEVKSYIDAYLPSCDTIRMSQHPHFDHHSPSYIQVDLEKGTFVYPKPEGFNLDMDRMYDSAARFATFCGGNLEMAVRQAIHQQLAAYEGLRGLRGMIGL